MLPQIRISKTPKIKTGMRLLSKKYPALSESEIVKFLIGQEVRKIKLEIKEDENTYTLKDIKPTK